MKLKTIEITNIGSIEHSVVEIDKPLVLFFGDIKQGKTTHLNSIKWLLGANPPKDLIKHGETTASIRLEFDNAEISRDFYINKKGEMKAKPLEFIRDGLSVAKPAQVLAGLVNPFLLNQRHFTDMSTPEKNRFLCGLFGIDFSESDRLVSQLKKEAQETRAAIKATPIIESVEVEKPESLEDLTTNLRRINHRNQDLKKQYEDEKNTEFLNFTKTKEKVIKAAEKITSLDNQIQDLKTQLIELEVKRAIYGEKPKIPVFEESQIKPPDLISTETIEEIISDAKADQIRYDQYLKDIETAKKRQQLESDLSANQETIKSIESKKITKLTQHNAAIAEKIPGLEITETGLVFQNTALDLLSGSQLITLSSCLAGIYPSSSDLNLELIDGAESLGKSIFDFVDRATEQELTILATIVGESPAETPEGVGVYVVGGGKSERK